ncbi:MAG: nuclear transport factor 2 family protein [Xanthobacteraceae bacterium]
MSDAARQKMVAFVDLFRAGDFDAIRAMLADDVKLDLMNRFKWEGRDKIVPYFRRYAEETKWRFTFGAVEGRPAMLVFESSAMEKPAYFVLVDWRDGQISMIRDFLFAPCALESVD